MQKKTDDNSNELNLDIIYENILPYLEKPEFIKQFIIKHSNILREKLIKLIECEIENSDQIKKTDLRILLNAIQ